jgi:hypothetical protein
MRSIGGMARHVGKRVRSLRGRKAPLSSRRKPGPIAAVSSGTTSLSLSASSHGAHRDRHPLRHEGGRCAASGGWRGTLENEFARCASVWRFRKDSARLGGERATFVSASSQNHCARHGGFGNVVLPQLPCASRAKRAGANYSPPPCGSPYGPPPAFKSAVPADLVARPCARTCAPCSRLALRCSAPCKGARKSSASQSAIHGLVRSKMKQCALLRLRAGSAPIGGPSNTARGRRTCPKDGAQDVRQFAVGPWMARRRTPAVASVPVVHGWTQGVFAGWPSLW